MAKNERFEVIYQEGNGLTSAQRMVLMDRSTGVQYLYVQAGYSGGLCALIDKDGKPVTWDV
ncbi:MAG: xylan 1,4-beta-xylosidase [Oscillospiraceae bacterium]|nr:xylan 1,4-beta-xylosidase [Oscillospiraceae bacterium]